MEDIPVTMQGIHPETNLISVCTYVCLCMCQQYLRFNTGEWFGTLIL